MSTVKFHLGCNHLSHAAALVLIFLSIENAFAETEVKKNSASKEKQYWALSTDNDALVPRSTDRDFTAGIAVTYSGRSGLKYWREFDKALENIDKALGLIRDIGSEDNSAHSIEFGVYGFTPDQIELEDAQINDRPFASLVYLSASRTYLAQNGNAWSSSLTLGVLGLDLLKGVQNRVHKIIGSAQAEGWGNQISDGGELTLRYQTAHHHYWGSNTSKARFKTSYFGSIGYLTEAGVAVSTRQGRISSPDHRFNPDLITYGERAHDATGHSFNNSESYLWGGIALKVRAYNTFLQGQFRDSDHKISSSDLRPLLMEAWIGYTCSFDHEITVSYLIRAQTSEIRYGEGDRSLLWGGIMLSKSM